MHIHMNKKVVGVADQPVLYSSVCSKYSKHGVAKKKKRGKKPSKFQRLTKYVTIKHRKFSRVNEMKPNLFSQMKLEGRDAKEKPREWNMHVKQDDEYCREKLYSGEGIKVMKQRIQ